MPADDHSAADAAFGEDVLRAADQAFQRVMTGVADQVETMPPGLEPADALRWAGDRVTELLAGIAELPLDRLVDLVPAAADGSAAADDPGPDRAPESGPSGEPITVRATPGSVVETRIWVHLVGRVPTSTLRLVLTDLVGPCGQSLAGAAAEFVPAELTVPAPAITSVRLRLPIPPQTAAGSHLGLVIGQGIDGACVPITVVVG